MSSGEDHPFSLPEWRENWMGHPHIKIIITGIFKMVIICNAQQAFTVGSCFSCATAEKVQFYQCNVIYTTGNLESLDRGN